MSLLTSVTEKLTGVNWLKAGLIAGVFVGGIATYGYIYHRGYSAGSVKVQGQWDAAKAQYDLAIAKKTGELQLAEQSHDQESKDLSNDLKEAKASYEARLAYVSADYADSLRASELRASYYQSLGSSDSAQCGSLASHAAELDRSLVEGRQLVQEFRATLELREASIKALGEQILSDRKLMDSNGQ